MAGVRHMLRVAPIACAVAAACVTTAVAQADPQSSTLCPEGARTSVPDGRLQCNAGQWQPYSGAHPSERWLTYGPPVKLAGEGVRDPEITSGDWIGVPQDRQSACRAEQVAAANPPDVSVPAVTSGQPGRPLALKVAPGLRSITLSGDCLWRRVD